MQTLRAIRMIHAHAGGTTSLSFSPDGTMLATGGYDSALRLWDVATGQERRSLAGQRRGHVAFSPDGAWLVSSGLHADAILYECATWQARQTLPNTAAVWGLAFVPAGRRLAILQPQTPLQLWDTQAWQIAEQIELGHEYVYALAFAPTSPLLAFATSENGVVHIRRADFREELATFSAHQPFTYGMAFSPSTALLATGGADRKIRLWDTAGWSPQGEAELDDAALCTAFSLDGRFLLAGSLDGSVSTWAIG